MLTAYAAALTSASAVFRDLRAFWRENNWYPACSVRVRMGSTSRAATTGADDFWADLNRDILRCLATGPVSPGEIGRRLGISEAAAASCLSMLAAEGRVRICLVERSVAAD